MELPTANCWLLGLPTLQANCHCQHLAGHDRAPGSCQGLQPTRITSSLESPRMQTCRNERQDGHSKLGWTGILRHCSALPARSATCIRARNNSRMHVHCGYCGTWSICKIRDQTKHAQETSLACTQKAQAKLAAPQPGKRASWSFAISLQACPRQTHVEHQSKPVSERSVTPDPQTPLYQS